ncbi:MAG: hypothetical protein KDC38_16175 [Planctomycetes bacterium]|nr:hypothetical protein [Planctomycetota bacterium]
MPFEYLESELSLSTARSQRLIRDLRFLCIGTLLVSLDLRIGVVESSAGAWTFGFRFDVLNDIIGGALILVALRSVATIPAGPLYAQALRFGMVIAWVQLGLAVADHFVFGTPNGVQLVLGAYGVVVALAVVRFVEAMVRLTDSLRLESAVGSWYVTRRWVVAFVLVPSILAELIGLVVVAFGETPRWTTSTGPALLLALALFGAALIAGVHFLLSVHRTSKAVQLYRSKWARESELGSVSGDRAEPGTAPA